MLHFPVGVYASSKIDIYNNYTITFVAIFALMISTQRFSSEEWPRMHYYSSKTILNIHRSQNTQNGYQDSAHIQVQSSVCWKHL